jgi:hypothetical protein
MAEVGGRVTLYSTGTVRVLSAQRSGCAAGARTFAARTTATVLVTPQKKRRGKISHFPTAKNRLYHVHKARTVQYVFDSDGRWPPIFRRSG